MISFPEQRWVSVLALLLFCILAPITKADPENFIVDGFTFVRPVKWKWVLQDKLADKGLLLKIPGTSTNDMGSVYFKTFSGDEGTAEKRINSWREYYKKFPKSLKVRSETKTIGSYTAVCVEMEGLSPLAFGKEFSVFAFVIQTKDGNFVVRMSGRKKLIDTVKPEFNEMVERALKSRETE